MARYPLSIAVLIFAMVCVSLGASAYLYLVRRWRMLSAYLAASPGGMSQVLVVAAELDATSAASPSCRACGCWGDAKRKCPARGRARLLSG